MTELHHPEVTGTVRPVNTRQRDALMRTGWRPVKPVEPAELPPISLKDPSDEYTRLRARKLPDSDPAMKNLVLGRADDQVNRIGDRVEIARADALWAGEVTIAENGVVATIDFGRDSSHNASASVPWSATATATADPIKDLADAAELIRDKGGEPTRIIMNSVTWNKMLATDRFKSSAVVGGVQATVVPVSVVSALLTEFLLPQITIYNRRTTVGGSPRKFVKDNQVLILDDTSPGLTPFGMTAEQLEFGGDGTLTAGGLFTMSWKTRDPVTVWTKTSAIAVPVLTSPNHTVGLDVS